MAQMGLINYRLLINLLLAGRHACMNSLTFTHAYTHRHTDTQTHTHFTPFWRGALPIHIQSNNYAAMQTRLLDH